MRLSTLFAAAAAALTATVGIAAEAPQTRFTHDGRTYVYTTTARDNGSTLIVGRELNSSDTFRLLVKDGRVTGTSGGHPVSFRADRVDGAVAVAASN